MSKKHQKNIERQIIDIVNSRGNDNKCGECGATYPTWASWNLGIFLCGRCASVHRRVLGPDVSKVKSLTLDNWTADQIDHLRRIGNHRARRKWNAKRVPFPFEDEDDEIPIENYIRDKYLLGKFREDSFGFHDLDDRSGGYSDDGLSVTSRLRSSSVRLRGLSTSLRSVPRLSHRKLTPQELDEYPQQVKRIVRYGYSDLESISEALQLSRGNIDGALDILENDIKLNPANEELPPALPKRPSSGPSFQSNNPMNTLLDPKKNTSLPVGDWWSGSQNTTAPVTANTTGSISVGSAQSSQPQIYQYTDPVTGRISYIDSNGQEYLDPNNPQHQQLLQQNAFMQQNPQLIQQQTNKLNILSLYNQSASHDQGGMVTGQPTGLQQFFTQQLLPQSQLQQQQQQLQLQQLQQQQLQQQQFQQQMQQQQTGFSGFNYQPTGFAPQNNFR